jgi:RHS repeat-associated protein
MSCPPAQPPANDSSSLYSTQAAACTSGWAQIKGQVPGFQNATASFSNGVCTLSLNGSPVTTLPVYDNRGQYITVDSAISSIAVVSAYRDDGHIMNFTASGSGFSAEAGVGYQLVTTASGGYQLIDEQDNVETYDGTGKLLSVADRAGNTQTLTYSTGLLASISDNFGHTLTFAYDNQNRLTSVTAPDGSTVQYGYNSSSYLSQVTNLDGTTRQYNYADPNWATGISSVVDENGQTELSLSYNSQGQAVSSTLGGVSSSMSFGYNSDGSTTETDPLGAGRTFQFQQVGDHELSSAVTGAPCFKCDYVAATTYDGGGFLASETDFNGNVTTYVFDDTRGLETSRTEASGAAIARTITTQWSSTYRLPTLISEYAGGTASGNPIRTTSSSYDGSGNLLSKTITDPATGATRTWSYTYDGDGRILTATDPRQNVTTYTYYTCTTGSQCGELDTVTDALTHVTTYNTYNADGYPLTITDPNGVVTTLTYDARDRLTSRTTGGETASFSYYPTGLLEQVTLPDGSSLSYAYDAAHRLTQVGDGLGNKVVYTLDAMGNRTAENNYDPSGTLHRTHTRVINTLNEVYQEVNAAGTSAVTTTFAYDYDSNATSIDAPLSRNTTESYDALNRVSSITDPGNGLTSFSYDAEDDLTSVVDPRSLTTSYGYDGFGELVSQASPDTGTTNNTYDSAGNLVTSTDARGAVATYGYDALNRANSIAYSLSGNTDQTLSFTYDQGTDGIGHLTGASDTNHSMSFSYDALGEMTGMSQSVGEVTRSISYGYTNGNLTSITTPSGQTVTYGYNANHQVTSIAVNGTTVVSNVSYEPFGPVDGWTWGNGTAFSRSFTGDGLIAGISNPGSQESLSYDNASRISGVTNTASGSSGWTYDYDNLDRVTSAAGSSVTAGWTYDADGNRLAETGTSPSTYSISSTSNQISGITGTLARSYVYDATGNIVSDSTDTDTYNDAGRLKTVTNALGTTTFTYDAFGQMIEASTSAESTLYVYDQTGHLLGEYDGSGNLIQETVWLGDIPVATIQPSGSSVAIYYVETDQLDTPREVKRPIDNAVMWSWFTGPFGVETPNTNPQGAGTFTYDLRLPGQIAGAWGSTFQNDHRDYDPAVGRYVESDPIGLAGGSFSMYTYVSSNPVMLVDPLGTNPGDSFPSAKAAAVDAFNYINSLQDCHTHEYAGWIYKEWSLFGPPTYTYDEPTELSPTGGVMPPMPAYHGTYAMFHNHPPLPGYDSDNYSPADEDTADYNNIPSYLEIPSGVIKRYTPNPGHPRDGSIDTVGKTSCSCKAQ